MNDQQYLNDLHKQFQSLVGRPDITLAALNYSKQYGRSMTLNAALRKCAKMTDAERIRVVCILGNFNPKAITSTNQLKRCEADLFINWLYLGRMTPVWFEGDIDFSSNPPINPRALDAVLDALAEARRQLAAEEKAALIAAGQQEMF